MTYSTFFLRSLFLVASLALAGCPSLPSNDTSLAGKGDPQDQRWLTHQQAVANLTHYQARGNFAYLSPEQKVSARFLWQQNGADAYRLLLTTPFGGKVVEMNVQPQHVQLTDDKNQLFISDTPEELISRLTQMQVPISHLRQWLVGLPGDNSTFIISNHYLLTSINLVVDKQQWQVNYKSYHNQLTPPLPRELELIQGERRIKLKIDNWIFE